LKDHRKQMAQQLVDGRVGLLLVQFDDHLALAVHPLADLGDEGLGHDGVGLAALGEVQDLDVVEAGHPPGPPHDMDDIPVAPGGDQANLRPPALEHGVGPDGGPQRQTCTIFQQFFGPEPQPLRGQAEGLHDAFGEVLGSGRGLGGHQAAVGVHHDAVSERPARVDADDIGHGQCSFVRFRGPYYRALPLIDKHPAMVARN
jgi:hypothetical protein